MPALSQYGIASQNLIFFFIFSIKNILLTRDNNGDISLLSSLRGSKRWTYSQKDLIYERRSTPIPHDIVNSENLCCQLDLSFQQQRLKHVDSEFFEVRGLTAATKEKHPFQQHFNATISSSLSQSMNEKSNVFTPFNNIKLAKKILPIKVPGFQQRERHSYSTMPNNP